MGLRTEFRAFVISQRVTTVEEAKDIALALEADCRRSDFRTRAERDVRRQQPQQQYPPLTAPRPPPPPVIAALPETTYPPFAAHAPTGPRRARGPPGSCYTCGQMGHYRDSCLQRPRDDSQSTIGPPQQQRQPPAQQYLPAPPQQQTAQAQHTYRQETVPAPSEAWQAKKMQQYLYQAGSSGASGSGSHQQVPAGGGQPQQTTLALLEEETARPREDTLADYFGAMPRQVRFKFRGRNFYKLGRL